MIAQFFFNFAVLIIVFVPLLLRANRRACVQNAIEKISVVFLYLFVLLLLLIAGVKGTLSLSGFGFTLLLDASQQPRFIIIDV